MPDTKCLACSEYEECTWTGQARLDSLARWLRTQPMDYQRDFFAKRGSDDLKAAYRRVASEG